MPATHQERGGAGAKGQGARITLELLDPSDRERFISDNQEAFNVGALEEFGCRDRHFEEEGQIISRETIEQSIDGGEALRILENGQVVGGAVVRIEGDRGELELLFVSPGAHSKGIGQAAWFAIEERYPEIAVWGLETPYFEKRNIHFYVNRCGFHIVEFYNHHHPDPNEPIGRRGPETDECLDRDVGDMFRFEKVLR